MSAPGIDIVLRFVDWEPTEACPCCHRNTTEPREEWAAFLADGNPDAALCGVCVANADDRIRIALDVLNLQPPKTETTARVDLSDDPEVPF